jgi:hypothetical protein
LDSHASKQKGRTHHAGAEPTQKLGLLPNCVREALGRAGEALELARDAVSLRSRRWTRNPLGSARRGSNPLGVAAGKTYFVEAPVVWWLRRQPHTLKVATSILARCIFTPAAGWRLEAAGCRLEAAGCRLEAGSCNTQEDHKLLGASLPGLVYQYFHLQILTPAGLEPAIPGSVGRCLIHWATGPDIWSGAVHETGEKAGGALESCKRASKLIRRCERRAA